MPTNEELQRVLDEHAQVLRDYGQVQRRCTTLLQDRDTALARCQALLAQREADIERRDADIMRLRAAVIARDTALAFAREDHASLAACIPGLPRRLALVRHIDMLVQRIQTLTRERAQAWGVARKPAPRFARLPDVDLRRRAVLWIGRDPDDCVATRHWIERAGGRFLQHDGKDDADPAALEASLKQADFVICQTGCISHGSYWRAQDHCRRTGKQCVLVDAAAEVG